MKDDLQVYGTRWSSDRAADSYKVYDPATGQAIAIVQGSGPLEVDACVRCADETFRESWRWLSPHERGAILKKCAGVIREHFEEIAQLETLEGGKPIFISRSDTRRCEEAFDYFGGLIGNLPTDLFDLGSTYASILLEPYGVVAGIVPFNWPPLHFGAKVAPALAVGNTVVVKPGDQAPLAVMRIAELLQAVLPKGVLEIVAGPGAAVGIALTAHPLVKKISFTGSSLAGKAVLKQVADNLTPCLMELGGKNNFIVLPGCVLDKVVPVAHEGAFYNNGQACTATSRILVHRSQYEEFVEKLACYVKRTRVGDGADEKVHVGPLITLAQQQKVLEYIRIGQSEGAVIAAQGKIPQEGRFQNGYFVPPTLFAQVKPGMRIAQEEIFGPVVCALAYEDTADAVRIANDTEYGLIAVVYGQDMEEAWRVARQMDVGSVYINNFYRAGKNCVPFGGNKGSGFGRERSIETLHEFGRSKTVKTISGIGEIPVWRME